MAQFCGCGFMLELTSLLIIWVWLLIFHNVYYVWPILLLLLYIIIIIYYCYYYIYIYIYIFFAKSVLNGINIVL